MRSTKRTAQRPPSLRKPKTPASVLFALGRPTQGVPLVRNTAKVLALALLTSACVSRPVVYGDASSCVDLVPSSWQLPTPPAALPLESTVGAWEKFGDAQTAQLDKANGEKVEGLGIVKRCQARDAAALAKVRKFRLF